MVEYICKKCGDRNEGRTEIKGTQIGLYCTNCGSWIKWLPKDEYAKRSGKPLNAIVYHCFKMKENCAFADSYGNCTIKSCAKPAIKPKGDKQVELPDKLTINGVVYVKKGE